MSHEGLEEMRDELLEEVSLPSGWETTDHYDPPRMAEDGTGDWCLAEFANHEKDQTIVVFSLAKSNRVQAYYDFEHDGFGGAGSISAVAEEIEDKLASNERRET